MAQVPAARYQTRADSIDYTPGSAVTAGDVVVLGSMVAIADSDIAANELGALALEGVFKVPKITGALTVGVPLYWGPTANPVGGTAGTGAATGTAGSLKKMGYVAEAAASGDETVKVVLRQSV